MKNILAFLFILAAGFMLGLVCERTPPIEVEKIVTKEVIKFVNVPVPGPEQIVEVDVPFIVEKPVIVEKVVTETIEVPTYIYEAVEVPVDRVVDRIVERTVYVEVMPRWEPMPCWRGRRR